MPLSIIAKAILNKINKAKKGETRMPVAKKKIKKVIKTTKKVSKKSVKKVKKTKTKRTPKPKIKTLAVNPDPLATITQNMDADDL